MALVILAQRRDLDEVAVAAELSEPVYPSAAFYRSHFSDLRPELIHLFVSLLSAACYRTVSRSLRPELSVRCHRSISNPVQQVGTLD